MTGEVLVYGEVVDGEIDTCTLEILGSAGDVARALHARVSVLLLGDNVTDQAKLFSDSGVDEVTIVEHPLLKYYNPEAYAAAIVQVISQKQPSIFFLGYTHAGMELAPTVATRLNLGLVSNCIGVKMEGNKLNKLQLVRSMYQGKICAKVEVTASKPVVVSVQKGALPLKDLSARTVEVNKIEPKLEESRLRTKAICMTKAASGDVDITKAEIVVGVGRGVLSKENLPKIKDFARAIGGVVACSRPLVDLGWLPQELLVGLSGKTVRPKLYVALGISGAPQHVAGMRGSRTIIAINKDPAAPIFQIADYGVVDELFKILPVLTEQAAKLKKP
jgi:electron transfer flavoprotein alpha subunit